MAGNTVNRPLKRYLATTLLLCASQATLALPPENRGESVRSIPDAQQISDWTTIDNQRVVISVNATDTYLLTLKQQCHGLGWAQNIKVTMSNNTIWAGFDEITADGLLCPIDHISRMSGKDLQDLQTR
jgi:hypothetical protein